MRPLSDAAMARLRLVDPPVLPERYVLGEMIGQGGMGVVYRARDRQLEREVAIKVLRLELDRPEWVARLQREARILARLEHPGIVAVHDVGVLPDGRAFYVMKWIRGQSLTEVARQATVPELLRVFIRITETVGFAHAAGVIHRDLKPANIMLGDFGEVLVLDWGIARVLGEPEPQLVEVPETGAPESATAPGTVLGTTGFMAPEQASGAVSLIDQRTDVFALGKLLQAALEFGSGPEATRPLQAIIHKASAADPGCRYTGAEAMRADVLRFLDGLPVTAYRETFLERATRVYLKYQSAILLILTYLVVRLLFLATRRL